MTRKKRGLLSEHLGSHPPPLDRLAARWGRRNRYQTGRIDGPALNVSPQQLRANQLWFGRCLWFAACLIPGGVTALVAVGLVGVDTGGVMMITAIAIVFASVGTVMIRGSRRSSGR
jgi:hypothetical protein